MCLAVFSLDSSSPLPMKLGLQNFHAAHANTTMQKPTIIAILLQLSPSGGGVYTVMSNSETSTSRPSLESRAKRAPCLFRLCTAQARARTKPRRQTTEEGGSCTSHLFFWTWLMLSAAMAPLSPAPGPSSLSKKPRIDARSTTFPDGAATNRCSTSQCLRPRATWKTHTEPFSSAAMIRDCCCSSMAAATMRPSRPGHSMYLTSNFSKSKKPHSEPAQKSKSPGCA
mmetsp:Transcript_40284/g.110880  ORF Transcript_40284/g.110880 Transcript_40284/m.110880 type:complete len:226 (+) Transcript_40284:222-899(+)